jgi:hypothetical protein
MTVSGIGAWLGQLLQRPLRLLQSSSLVRPESSRRALRDRAPSAYGYRQRPTRGRHPQGLSARWYLLAVRSARLCGSLIGIGGGRATTACPHHHPDGSRSRRFGRFRQRKSHPNQSVCFQRARSAFIPKAEHRLSPVPDAISRLRPRPPLLSTVSAFSIFARASNACC